MAMKPKRSRSGGGKWIIEAPYVMQAANDLKVHLGWAVQVYNAAEALPNLINPFWMLPLLGILKLRARDVIGFTMLQFIVHVPVVLLLLWGLPMAGSRKPRRRRACDRDDAKRQSHGPLVLIRCRRNASDSDDTRL